MPEEIKAENHHISLRGANEHFPKLAPASCGKLGTSVFVLSGCHMLYGLGAPGMGF